MVKRRSHSIDRRRLSTRSRRRKSRRSPRRKQTGRGVFQKLRFLQKSKYGELPDDLKRKIFKDAKKPTVLEIPNSQLDSFQYDNFTRGMASLDFKTNTDYNGFTPTQNKAWHGRLKYGDAGAHRPRTRSQIDDEFEDGIAWHGR